MDNGNRPPLTEKEAYKKALKRGTRYRFPSVNLGVVIAAAMLVTVIAVCTAVILWRDSGDSPAISTSVTSVSETTENADTAGTVLILTREDVAKGELILVNSDHEFVFPEIPEDVSVYDNKTISYKVNDKNVTLSMTALTPFNKLMDDFYAAVGCRDVMVVSGYRTEEFQRQLYSDRVESDGVEIAAQYVALPGQSEHHTGLAMDLSVYTDGGEGFAVRTYEKCKWLVENFENYGFILRYPEEKAEITGISYESWHYRYVGLPHSLIMKERGLCLEEYVEYLHSLGENTALLWDSASSSEGELTAAPADAYAIYYVPAADDGDTVIRIPENREYTVSGDNVSGFIITLLPVIGGNTNE